LATVRALIVGLTGGVAAGKSYVAGLFEALGVPLLDADQVSRDVVTPPSPVLDQIAARFGQTILAPDASLDRAKLRAIVFADPQARRDLEAITHPAIRAAIRAWLAQQSGAYCILANAILIESGMDQLVDRILVVDAPEAVQMERLMQRDGMDQAGAERMLAAQIHRSQRLLRAKDLIDNSNPQRNVISSVHRLHRLYQRMGSSLP
jgi:dephospho-CoA kinase